MLFYSFESLDEFIENNLIISIQSETNRLDQISNLYEIKKANLDTITINLINTTNTIDKNKLDDFYSVSSSLKSSFEELENICTLVNILRDSLKYIISLHDRNVNDNYNEIKAELIEYNKKSDQLYHQIFNFENTTTNILTSALELFPNQIKKKNNSKKKVLNDLISDILPKNNIEVNREDNDILLISEKTQKAYLPYKYTTVKEIFLKYKDTYTTMQDVVDTIYVLPLNKFQNPSIARFREAFYLIRKKEQGSIAKALDLALELMFKYELNPIIIAACRNLDELDIYLDCLDKNELYEFNCFEIKFEVLPKISKK